LRDYDEGSAHEQTMRTMMKHVAVGGSRGTSSSWRRKMLDLF
jgi:hypothetical protein